MERIVDGNIMGIRVYGKVTDTDMERFKTLMDALEALRKSLTTLFNDNVAEMALRNVLKDTHLSLSYGEVEDKENWESLVEQGLVFKSESEDNG